MLIIFSLTLASVVLISSGEEVDTKLKNKPTKVVDILEGEERRNNDVKRSLESALDSMKFESRRSSDGSCHLSNGIRMRHGEVQQFSCQTFRCENGQLNKLRGGCRDKRGICYNVGQEYVDGCFKDRCEEDGTFTLVAEGCSWGNGECKRVNEQWTQGCYNYRCHKSNYGTHTMYQKIKTINGCQMSGSCIRPGATQRDTRNCAVYRCDKSQQGNHIYVQMVLVNAECKTRQGQCYRNNERWRNGCIEYTCSASRSQYRISGQYVC